MTEYKAFSNTVVVFKEPTISQIVPKSGPNAGKETSVLEFKAYKPHFVKQQDGSFLQDKDGTEFFSVRQRKLGKKNGCGYQRRNDA